MLFTGSGLAKRAFWFGVGVQLASSSTICTFHYLLTSDCSHLSRPTPSRNRLCCPPPPCPHPPLRPPPPLRRARCHPARPNGMMSSQDTQLILRHGKKGNKILKAMKNISSNRMFCSFKALYFFL